METVMAKKQAKTLIDSLNDVQILAVLNFLQNLQSRASNSETEFPFDNLVNHTERADFADQYIRNFRDSDRF